MQLLLIKAVWRQHIAEEAASNAQGGGIKAADIVWMTPEDLRTQEGVSIDFQADGKDSTNGSFLRVYTVAGIETDVFE